VLVDRQASTVKGGEFDPALHEWQARSPQPARKRRFNMTPSDTDNDFLGGGRLQKIASVNAALLSMGGSWIHRRKEAVKIIDETALRRQVSVDFILPRTIKLAGKNVDLAVKRSEDGARVFCPPLFVLPKRPSDLMAFDLTNEAGISLPLMTMADNGLISAATLVALAKRLLGEDLQPVLAARFEALAQAETDQQMAAQVLMPQGPGSVGADQIQEDSTVDGAHASSAAGSPMPMPAPGNGNTRPLRSEQEQLEELRESETFRWWVWTLSHSSLVVVPYRGRVIRRMIFRLSYQQPITYSLPVRARLGWEPYKVAVDSSWIDSRNFHFEAEAPPGLRIASATLIDDRAEPISDSGFLRRTHLFRYSAERAGAASASLDLRVSGHGFIGGAFMASTLVLLAVGGCWFEAENIAKSPTSAPALLLLLPALIASYIARPDQHALTTRLLSFARWLLLLSSGIAYACAAFVALDGGPVEISPSVPPLTSNLKLGFLIGSLMALVPVVGLLVGWVLTKPKMRWIFGLRWRRFPRFEESLDLPHSMEDVFAAVCKDVEGERVLFGRTRQISRDRAERELVVERFDRVSSWRFTVNVSEALEGSRLKITGDCSPRRFCGFGLGVMMSRETRAMSKRLEKFADRWEEPERLQPPAAGLHLPANGKTPGGGKTPVDGKTPVGGAGPADRERLE
jgi:hypothetical protein